jgi:Cytochrome P450
VTFGLTVRVCATTFPSVPVFTASMGNRLAEMQLRILWEEALQRFETIEVVGEPKRTCNLFIRGFTELPVKVTRFQS